MRELILASSLFTVASACVSIDGGAVEVSWVLRSDDGRAVSTCGCADPPIAAIRLSVVPRAEDGTTGPDVCAGRPACEFPCGRHTGTTPFDVPPGTYIISVRPLGAAGEDLSQPSEGRRRLQPPAPILRGVVEGQVSQPDTIPIVVGCAAHCAGEDSTKVCASQ